MWWDHDINGWGAWGWLLMTFMMLAFWGLVAWTVVTLTQRGDTRRPEPGTPDQTARRILDERLARGEIDDEEYRQRRALLDQR